MPTASPTQEATSGPQDPSSTSPWKASVLTLHPDLFPGPLGASVLGRGLAEGHWALETVNIRDFSDNKYGSVDDTPSGGGAGLIIRADILAAAFDSITAHTGTHISGTDIPDNRPKLYLSPRGKPFDQARARQLAEGPGIIALCGRFEGIDARILDARNIEEVSIGDFVLAGGEIAAMAMIEACVRLIPGVLGSAQSLGVESFDSSLLEHPHYTRPRTFEGRDIPAVLQSGDHKKIAEWRQEQAEHITRTRRPDLYQRYLDNGPIRRSKNKD